MTPGVDPRGRIYPVGDHPGGNIHFDQSNVIKIDLVKVTAKLH